MSFNIDFAWVLGALVAVAGIIGAFFNVKNSGKKEERAKQVEQTAKAQETFVDNTTKARQSDTPALDKGLSRWSRKP